MNYEVIQIPQSYTYDWLLKIHYAKRIPSISYAFGLYQNKILEGVCTFGTPANRNISNIIDGYLCLELNRLCISDEMPKNTTSFFISKCFQLLPKPLVLISYADKKMNHSGYIYQATNWVYTGLGGADVSFEKYGIIYHRRHIYEKLEKPNRKQAELEGYKIIKEEGKHRYFYFLGSKKEKKDMLNKLQLKFKILSYPKEVVKRYVINSQLEKQINII